ncbi:iron ABC transporter permease [Geobacter sp. FeAm09]|uniref:FecCD family ABC transporter permease n=1 Tax=Geobacter sp. FeAm09 TaxID=2597769 RepID=UPI0011F00F09|nr:iron ABC transporter permease [Geobacter sp. FeAm09]QEM68964.1 iron ABC transporter permease [Geobacter sp. FeAm09]
MKSLKLLVFALILVLVMLVSLALGKYPLQLTEIVNFLAYRFFGWGTFDAERLQLLHNLIIEIRLPRIINAALIGAALSVSGAAYQAIFINPLADPKILGVLAGASFGASLGMVFLKTWYAVQVSTLIGGFAAVGITIGVARLYRINSPIMLVLGGIVSEVLFMSLLSIVKYISDPYNQLPAITYWLLGNTAMADMDMAVKCGTPICLGIICLIFLGRHLNVLSMGDEEARALGVNVELVRMTVIICATVVSTLTVVMAGMINWVGLIIPHIVRMMIGPDNETLMPASVLVGASYLVVADDVSRLAFNFEIPIGIVTSLVGIVFFLLVLKNAQKGWQ